MVTLNPELYQNDLKLPALASLDIKRLRDALAAHLPPKAFDAPVDEYFVENIRYKPGSKMVVGLASNEAKMPLALRIFPRGKSHNRWREAVNKYPGLVYEIAELDAVVWTFPAERKLDLSAIEDKNFLSKLFKNERDTTILTFEPIHYVPEHTFTAKVLGQSNGRDTVDFLKIYHNNQGADTERVMRGLTKQTFSQKHIAFPEKITYLKSHRLLIQNSLNVISIKRNFIKQSDALARLHHHTGRNLRKQTRLDPVTLQKTLSLVSMVFPDQRSQLAKIFDKLSEFPANLQPAMVFLHGDAHFGNLLQLNDGRTGIIDLDGCCWGPAELDLATYYGFRFWVSRKDKLDLTEMQSFLEAYNHAAPNTVHIASFAYYLTINLACHRVARGIARGKITTSETLQKLLHLAEQVIDIALQNQLRYSA